MKKIVWCILFLTTLGWAQQKVKIEGTQYEFTAIKDNEATSVKNQQHSSTCWSFSTLSFFESELKRMGKGDFDLSEMWVVRNAYIQKAVKYVRLHGLINFGPGGAFHDPLNVLKNNGLLPGSAYANLLPGDKSINHDEMDKALKNFVDGIAKSEKISQTWVKAFEGMLDGYLGKPQESFTYNGKTYTAKTFSDMLGLKAEDYVDITSYSHHPYYSKFILEIPDNWSWDPVTNVPLDDMIKILDHALTNGYTAAWGADVSDKGFAHRKGLAMIPDKDWSEMSKAEKDSVFIRPVKQKVITQEIRQRDYDTFETTDDHGMQITGLYKDANGGKWYKIKNSWGEDNPCGGYFYASENYIRLRTMNFMIHKDGLPKDIKDKLGIK